MYIVKYLFPGKDLNLMRNHIVSALLLALILATGGLAEPDAKKLFQANCQVCHGVSGKGDGPAASALATAPRDLTRRPYKNGCGPGAVARTIKVGIAESGMPPFQGQLNDDEIWSLANYVRGLQSGCCR